MPAKRSASTRRRGKTSTRGRASSPAALVFLAGVALALIGLFFGYAFYYLPAEEAARKAAQNAARQGASSAQGQQAQTPSPSGQQPTASPQGPGQTAAQGGQTQPQGPSPQSGSGQPQGASPPAGAGQPQVAPAQAATAQPQGASQQAATPPAFPQPKPGQPRLVIVIDDLGGSLDQARDLAALGIPVTFSVLPGLAHSRETASLAAASGQEIILHQPLEAQAARQESPGMLRSGASVPETAALLADNLARVPGAVGVGNHEGSRGSEDAVLMAALMTALKERGLFFLDSLTSPRSEACREAAKARVPCLTRGVFLDNERGQQAALLKLAEAERLARTKGQAIAIGHPHPETIAALAAWTVRRDKAVVLTTLSTLVKGR